MFGLSLTASYALRILAYLARTPAEWVRGADTIAEGTGVPRAYAVKLLHQLGLDGFVQTKVGCHGGYRLVGDPDRTSALDVITAMDGPELFERCLMGAERCFEKRKCALHPLWSKERARIRKRLEGLTLGLLASLDTATVVEDDRKAIQERLECISNGSVQTEGES